MHTRDQRVRRGTQGRTVGLLMQRASAAGWWVRGLWPRPPAHRLPAARRPARSPPTCHTRARPHTAPVGHCIAPTLPCLPPYCLLSYCMPATPPLHPATLPQRPWGRAPPAASLRPVPTPAPQCPAQPPRPAPSPQHALQLSHTLLIHTLRPSPSSTALLPLPCEQPATLARRKVTPVGKRHEDRL